MKASIVTHFILGPVFILINFYVFTCFLHCFLQKCSLFIQLFSLEHWKYRDIPQ